MLKTYISIAAAAVIVSLVVWYGNGRYKSGYNSAMAERLTAVSEQDQADKIALKKALEASKLETKKAVEQLNQIKARPPAVITKYEQKIIERNVCRAFDSEFISLLDSTSPTELHGSADGNKQD